MTNEEIKELYTKIHDEKTDESNEKSNEKSKNDMWPLLLLSLLVFSSGGQTPNIALEKEVSYLHGKVDAIEKIMAEKK